MYSLAHKLVLLTFGMGIGLFAHPYNELVPKFNRKKSLVMVREIASPTQANLDYAAYNNNPVRHNPEKFKPKKPKGKILWDSLNFNGAILKTALTLEASPLSDSEKAKPMAWPALKNLIWEKTKTEDIAQLTAKINAYKWADPSIYPSYQKVVTAWIHQEESGPSLWVEIEFAHWVKFVKGLKDWDNDGFAEIYGKLNLSGIPAEKTKPVFEWMEKEYLKQELSRSQVMDWAQLLASYWYPSLNTDLVPVAEGAVWPNEDTEKKIRKQLKKVSIKNPTIVIRGNPLGKPIYNVFHIPHFKKPDETSQATDAQEASSSSLTEASAQIESVKNSPNYIANQDRFKKEFETYGAPKAWENSLEQFRNEQKAMLASLPDAQMGIEGKNKWLFFRKSLEYSLAEDLSAQEDSYNPTKHIVELKNYLGKNNIDFLFVPVPPKTEVYPEHLKGKAEVAEIVNPWGRYYLKQLQENGIEVIDLLPIFLEEKNKSKAMADSLYQLQDTHWTSIGLKLAAQKIAERIKEYKWYSSISSNTSVYNVSDTTILKRGDIVERLPEDRQAAYPAVPIANSRVLKDGNGIEPDKNSPILLIGDSFTGVFEHIDGKSGGVGSHIAQKIGRELDIITSWGGGPLVRKKMMRTRSKKISEKKLLIYMMAARDLFHYSQKWEDVDYK